jgi:hypothetical protein
MTAIKSPPNNTTMDQSKIQFLDGRPVAIYIGPDQLLLTNRDEIAHAIAHKKQKPHVQQQMDKLFQRVAKWVESHKKNVVGFGGCWEYDETTNDSKSPLVTVYFAIVQVKSDKIDEPLWVDLADFDVQIAQDPEFVNVRMNISAVPNIKQETLLKYIKRHLR